MPLRLHQREALDAWRRSISAGVSRGWIVLPPGAGKTMVGVRAIRESGRTGVIFSPNIAIRGQWQAAAPEVRCLTYQALANFGDDPGGSTQLARLHPNGRALVAELAATENLIIVLDECHHLLRTWGRLLAEVLGLLPDAVVLGLTATPATALTGAEATLENELFGEITYSANIPQVVATGDLVPYQELGWLTNPTAAERDWLGEQQGRVQELLTHLSAPDRASVPLFEAVANLQANVSWEELAATDERLTDALLRLAHAGYAEPPIGVAFGERHRRDPGVEDWVAVLNQWLLPLVDSPDPRDHALILEVREVLPSIGYRWTRRGISAAASTMDRVLARSASKALAAVEIATLEEENLGADLRALVVCDFERATALPHGLRDVVTADSGSAWQTLKALAGDPLGQRLEPLLVTAGVVAGTPSSARALMDFAAERLPGHSLDTVEEEGLVRVLGWNVRQWVPVVTEFLRRGGTKLLVGTRGLLGEGWDAPGVNCLVDLTSATTPGAVVQLRGRSLRRDPENPGKVAINWSVACIADGVMGDADWRRLVRKHHGYLAPDEQGDLVDGVAHLTDGFSEFRHPGVDGIEAANVLAARRSRERDRVADQWNDPRIRTGREVSVVRVRSGTKKPPTGNSSEGAVPRGPGFPLWPWLLGAALVLAVLGLLSWSILALALAGTELLVRMVLAGRRLTGLAAKVSVGRVARAVADALRARGLVSAGAGAVVVEVKGQELRCRLSGVPAEESARFAEALDEALQPVSRPRYLISRLTADPPRPRDVLRLGLIGRETALETWHPVPSVLASNRDRADAYLLAWRRWVGEGEVRYARSPEGEGIVRAVRDIDPWQLTSAIRLHWE